MKTWRWIGDSVDFAKLFHANFALHLTAAIFLTDVEKAERIFYYFQYCNFVRNGELT